MDKNEQEQHLIAMMHADEQEGLYDPLTIKGVSIGDRFIHTNDQKSRRVSTVIDFVERRSVRTGKVIDYECVAEKEYMGQRIVFSSAFATVVRFRVK